MAHQRTRFASAIVKEDLTWAPSIGLLGMRQTGKSTLLKSLGASYYTFDDPLTVTLFERSGSHILEQQPYPIVLDEIQKAPLVFDLIKLKIDQGKIPGRFILTGSVRFSSRKAIRESLTGRIVLIELLPMALAECHSKPISHFVENAMSSNRAQNLIDLQKKNQWVTEPQIHHFLETGGLPGICLKRESSIQSQMFSNQLDTLLGRDIHLILSTKMSITKLRDLFENVCRSQGEPINLASLSRRIGTSIPTVKNLLFALEGLFLIRPHGKYYFSEDLGLGSHVVGGVKSYSNFQNLFRLLFHELRVQVNYRFSAESKFEHYSTRGGAFVPFIIRRKNHPTLAIGFDADELTSEKTLKGLMSFKKKNNDAKLVAVHQGSKAYLSSSGIACVPWTYIP